MTPREVLQPIAFGLFVLGLCHYLGTQRAAIGVAAGVVLWILLELLIRRRARRDTSPGPSQRD